MVDQKEASKGVGLNMMKTHCMKLSSKTKILSYNTYLEMT